MNICIVQARMGSTRLPRKVLLPLNGHTVIGEVLTRCKQIPGIDQVVCAIPWLKSERLLYHTAKEYCEVYCGPELDVLNRYYIAAEELKADVVMRITGDCPLISPELCGAILDKLIKEKADYSSNLEPRTFPKGMDCEAFTMETLTRANGIDKDREHVTTWMRSADIKRVNVESPWKLDGRLTLDTEDDYRVICAAFNHEPYKCLQAA